MAYLIGADIGTSGTKAVLFDEKGNTVAEALEEYPMYQPENGWAEQDPGDWWKAVCESIKAVISNSGVKNGEIAGVGLSGQMHGLVMLDKNDSIIRKAIIWCDQRTGDECIEITDKIGASKLIEITANPALTGFTASKIMWVKNHEPENYDKCAKIMLPKDYIRYMLTGEFATEVSDASGMQLLDIGKREWSGYVLEKLGIERDKLGKVYESCEVTGKINRFASEATGLKEGTIVVGGAGDQAAGAVGNGIVREGIASATIGTSGVVFVHTDKIRIDPKGRVHTFCHAVPNTWHMMGVTQGAGLSFKWMRDNFFEEVKDTAVMLGSNPNILMDKICSTMPCGANGLIYLPYLMGERTPHLDPNARGVFFGLSAIHTKKDMLRAVMEGVIYSLYDCVNVINEISGDSGLSTIFASGGGGNSALWRQMMADVFGQRISLNNSKQGGALGVAILAGVGAGLYSSVPEACGTLIHESGYTDSIPSNNKIYRKYYNLYAELYSSLKGCFKNLSDIK